MPIAIHRKLNWRIAFAAVSFILVLMLIGGIYTATAKQQFDTFQAEAGTTFLIISP